MTTAVAPEVMTPVAPTMPLPLAYPKREPTSSFVDVLTERTDITIEEAEALAEGRSFELVEGRMVFKMASKDHSKAQTYFAAKLFAYFEKHPIGIALAEYSVRLWPESKLNLRTPDVAVFLNENMHEEEKYEPRAPDLAIEIVSDDDRATELFAKGRLYLEKGSRVVWIVFPSEQSVLIMTPAERRWETQRLTCPEVLPGFELAVAEIFSWPKPLTAR